jgi:hypothetical protein
MHHLTRLTRLGLLLAASAALLAARDRGPDATPPSATGPQEVTVAGLMLDERTNVPTIVLQGKRDKRSFAMVIGHAEATGIALPLQNVTPPRPLTHDLFLTLFSRLHVKITRAVITDLRDDTYYATLYLSVDGNAMELDSRPSDAIALALRANAPVFAEERVFDKAEQNRPGSAGPGHRI